MNVLEAAGNLQGKIVSAVAEAPLKQVQGAYSADLLSDVIANGNEGDLWITLQRHVNIVAVAQLKGLAGVVLVNGRDPEAETLARAESEGIPIVCTRLPAFEVAGILHSLGIRGRRPA